MKLLPQLIWGTATPLLLSCALDVELESSSIDEAELQTVHQGLAAGYLTGADCSDQDGQAVQYWTRSSTVNFCYQFSNATTRAWFEEDLQNSWGRSANLNFVFEGTSCPSIVPSAWVTVYLSQAEGDYGIAAPGRGNRLTNSAACGSWYGSNAQVGIVSDIRESFRNLAIHEVGHALGFYHETGRTGQSHCGTSGTDSTGWLTIFDLYSVMSGCLGMVDGVQTIPIPDWRRDYFFSPLDALGAEMAYPRAQNPAQRLWCGERCIQTSNGVTIADNNGVIRNEWSARGGTNITSQFAVGTSQYMGTTLSGVHVSDGSPVTNIANSNGGFNQVSVNSTGVVTKSSSKYTALLMAAEGVLLY